MKIRKIAVMAVIVVGMCLVLTGCSKQRNYIEMPAERYYQILERLDRLEELETQQNASSKEEMGEGENEPAESNSGTDTTTAPVQPEEQMLTAAISSREGNKIDVSVFEDLKDALDKTSATPSKAEKIIVSLFEAPVSEISVATSASGYTTYTAVQFTTVSEVNGGYSTFNYECSEKTRVIFRIVTTAGNEYFISVRT